ncbi:MAG: glycosyltransferase family 10 [Saprospiraceae bacterium]
MSNCKNTVIAREIIHLYLVETIVTPLRITFSDFWSELDPENNFFINILRKIVPVVIDNNDPQLVFFSYYGNRHMRFRCPKIFYTGENIRPDFNACDYAISFDYPVTERNFRLPLYALYADVNLLCQPKNSEAIIKSKTRFCNFVVSNPQGAERNKFFKMLSKYKKVDSGGRFMNNIGSPVSDKLAFIKGYKFTIAFENSSYPGYTTEKIFQPMLENSLPIYWGNKLIGRDFNTKSFINIHDYPDFGSVIEQIISVDKDDSKYAAYLQEPYFTGNIPNEFVQQDNLIRFFKKVYNALPDLEPVARNAKSRLMANATFYQRRSTEIADYSIRNIRRLLSI